MIRRKVKHSKAPFWKGIRWIVRYIPRILVLTLICMFALTACSALFVKGIDGEIQRQEAVLEEHFRTHGVER